MSGGIHALFNEVSSDEWPSIEAMKQVLPVLQEVTEFRASLLQWEHGVITDPLRILQQLESVQESHQYFVSQGERDYSRTKGEAIIKEIERNFQQENSEYQQALARKAELEPIAKDKPSVKLSLEEGKAIISAVRVELAESNPAYKALIEKREALIQELASLDSGLEIRFKRAIASLGSSLEKAGDKKQASKSEIVKALQQGNEQEAEKLAFAAWNGWWPIIKPSAEIMQEVETAFNAVKQVANLLKYDNGQFKRSETTVQQELSAVEQEITSVEKSAKINDKIAEERMAAEAAKEPKLALHWEYLRCEQIVKLGNKQINDKIAQTLQGFYGPIDRLAQSMSVNPSAATDSVVTKIANEQQAALLLRLSSNKRDTEKTQASEASDGWAKVEPKRTAVLEEYLPLLAAGIALSEPQRKLKQKLQQKQEKVESVRRLGSGLFADKKNNNFLPLNEEGVDSLSRMIETREAGSENVYAGLTLRHGEDAQYMRDSLVVLCKDPEAIIGKLQNYLAQARQVAVDVQQELKTILEPLGIEVPALVSASAQQANNPAALPVQKSRKLGAG
ncbi:MAG: hypothetical protein ACOYK8_05925 [Alphaproteobacteria bacterium]